MKKNRLTRQKHKRRVRRIQKLFLISVVVLAAGGFLWNRCSRIIDNNLGVGDYSMTALSDSFIGKNEIERYAKKHGFTLSDYPEDMIELYEKNEEAREYVLEYPMNKDTVQEIHLEEYASADQVPLLMQWDQRWGYKGYAGAPMGLSGCGPTCLSMVTIFLTGDTSKNPAWMADFATEHGYAVDDVGSDWTLMSQGGIELGMDVTEIPPDRERVEDNLYVGNPIVAIMGPGDFTTEGHFIVLTGMEAGKWKVNDPNSRKNSEKVWDPDLVLGQARDLWVFRKAE